MSTESSDIRLWLVEFLHWLEHHNAWWYRLIDMFSVLRIPHGKPVPDDYTRGCDFIEQAAKLWQELHLPSTPKWHALLTHAIDQMESFGSFKDMMEDFIEQSHQLGDRADIQLEHIKEFEKKAAVQASNESTSQMHSILEVQSAIAQKLKRKQMRDVSLAEGCQMQFKAERDNT